MCGPFNKKSVENEIEVEILPNGTVKILTGRFAGAVHASAEAMMRAIAEDLGGTTTRERRAAHQHHDHDHDHADTSGGHHGSH